LVFAGGVLSDDEAGVFTVLVVEEGKVEVLVPGVLVVKVATLNPAGTPESMTIDSLRTMESLPLVRSWAKKSGMPSRAKECSSVTLTALASLMSLVSKNRLLAGS